MRPRLIALYATTSQQQLNNEPSQAHEVTKSDRAYHSESDVCLLERRSVVGSVAGHSDHLAVRVESTVNDAFDEVVLVLR